MRATILAPKGYRRARTGSAYQPDDRILVIEDGEPPYWRTIPYWWVGCSIANAADVVIHKGARKVRYSPSCEGESHAEHLKRLAAERRKP